MTDSHAPPSFPVLEALTRRALQHLATLGYTPHSLAHFQRSWQRLCTLARRHALPDVLSEELVDRFLRLYNVAPTAAGRTGHQRHLRRAVEVLMEFSVHGTVCRRRAAGAATALPAALHAAQVAYLAYCSTHLGARPTTLRIRTHHVAAFLRHLAQQGVAAPAAITPGHLSGFLRTRSHVATKTLAGFVCTLRSFLRVGCVLGWLPRDLSTDVPAVRVRPDAKIPAVWTAADLEALLAAVETASPVGKRDRAILLLACRLGLRAGDIRALTLDALRWPTARIAFAQQKTGAVVELPMSDEVATALIAYLQHGRPASAHREVFLRGRAPFEPFGANDNLHHIVTRYRRRAGLALPRTARRGLHSLRHSLATRLLARGVALATIGTVLGHQSLDATRIYTKVDVDALRAVALELPEVTS
jgi:site-specific recombinase XerD